jgi:hypothetical protein
MGGVMDRRVDVALAVIAGASIAGILWIARVS